jgi:hypothetical protein
MFQPKAIMLWVGWVAKRKRLVKEEWGLALRTRDTNLSM